MTCIVAITDGRRTILGADSAAGSAGSPEVYNIATSKLWKNGEYLIGICGTYRVGQIARWQMYWPKPPSDPEADLEEFMVREVIATLRRTLEKADYNPSKEPTRVGQFLIALRGQLFCTADDFSCVSLEAPWTAIGSGRHSAYGALHALADLELSLEDKVKRALAAAQAHTGNVRAPFHFLRAG